MTIHRGDFKAILALSVGLLGGVLLAPHITTPHVPYNTDGTQITLAPKNTSDDHYSFLGNLAEAEDDLSVDQPAYGRRQLWGLGDIKKELNKWKDKANDLADEIDDLKDEVNDLNRKITSLTNDVKDKASDINDLTNDVKNKATKINDLMAEVKDKANKVTDLTLKVGSLTTDLASKTSQVTDLTKTVNSLTNDVKNKASQVTDLTSKVGTLTNELKNKADLVTELTNKVSSLTNDVKSKANTVIDLTSKVGSLTNEVTNKASQITDLTSKVSSLTNDVKNKASQVTDLTSKVGSLTDDLKFKADMVTDLTNKVGSLTNEVKSKANQVVDLTSKVGTLTNEVANKASQITDLTNTVSTLANEVKTKTGQISDNSLKMANDAVKTVDLEAKVTTLLEEVASWKNKVESIPGLLEDKIVRPITKDLSKAYSDIEKISEIASEVAEAAVNVIKQLDFLPKTGADLGNLLSKQFKDFIGDDFCVPYTCIAEKLELDINDIMLYKSERLSVSTALTPKTCFEVTSIEFDASKLGNFLDLFRDLEALEEIFDKVYTYLEKEMSEIMEITDEVEELLDDIQHLANDAAKELGFRARRQLLMSAEDGRLVSKEEVAATAHEKGMEKFKELYGEHVQKVFQERKLAKSGSLYIGFQSLKVRLSVNFGQSITLKASDRAGYSGSIFDEAMHLTTVIPVPLTAGMVNIVASASMEASMPYAMAIEGEANAKFGYSVGNTAVTVDLVTGNVETQKEPFKTEFAIDATVGVSASMSLNFAASASLGICIGPTEDACITVTFDAKQTSAAGFDAIAGVNVDKSLTALYTDVLEYTEQSNGCEGDLSVDAGYWQYVEEPSVTVAITGTTCCSDKSDILYQREGGLLQKSIDSFCLATDVKLL